MDCETNHLRLQTCANSPHNEAHFSNQKPIIQSICRFPRQCPRESVPDFHANPNLLLPFNHTRRPVYHLVPRTFGQLIDTPEGMLPCSCSDQTALCLSSITVFFGCVSVSVITSSWIWHYNYGLSPLIGTQGKGAGYRLAKMALMCRQSFSIIIVYYVYYVTWSHLAQTINPRVQMVCFEYTASGKADNNGI